MVLFSEFQGIFEIRWFAVVRPKASHCICLGISTNNPKTSSSAPALNQDSAAVIPIENTSMEPHIGERSAERVLYVKVENDSVLIESESRINFAKPYTVEYNIKVRNVGRVFGDSVGLMERYFAEALGLTK